jgi:hypothetical protein
MLVIQYRVGTLTRGGSVELSSLQYSRWGRFHSFSRKGALAQYLKTLAESHKTC